MYDFLDRLANRRVLIVLFVIYALVFGAIIVTLTKLTALTGGIGILDFDVGYSAERVMQVFGSYGETGFALYGRIQLLDLINPAVYSLLFAVIVRYLWRYRNPAWVVFLPILAGFFDYAENLTIHILSRQYPDISGALVTASSTLSLAKNLFLYAAIVALMIGLVIWVRNWFRSGAH